MKILRAYLFFVASSWWHKSTHAKMTVLLEFDYLDNTGGKSYNVGEKCDGNEIFHRCDTYFEICIKPVKVPPSNLSDCWFYVNTSSKRIWRDNVRFKTMDVGVPKKIELRKDSWPGAIGFFMKIWDWDDPDATRSDLIDTHSFIHRVKPGINGSLAIYSNTTIGQRPNKPATVLTFRLRVGCQPYYFGPYCNKYCKDGGNQVEGYAVCDKNGKRNCFKGWYNEPKCNVRCQEKNDSFGGFYTCSKNGTHVCRPNRFNPPLCLTYCKPRDDDYLGHYTCDKNGTRICKQDWNGDGCNVTVSSLNELPSWGFPTTSTISTTIPLLKSSIQPTYLLSKTYFPSHGMSSTTNNLLLVQTFQTTPSSTVYMTKSKTLCDACPFSTARSDLFTYREKASVPLSSSISFASKGLSSAVLLSASFSRSAMLNHASMISTETVQMKRETKASFSVLQTSQMKSSNSLAIDSFFLITKDVRRSFISSKGTRNSDIESTAISHESRILFTSTSEQASGYFMSSVVKSTKCMAKNCKNKSNLGKEEGIFDWMMKTRKGNLVVVSFGLSFVFLLLLLMALSKIYRMRRVNTERHNLSNELIQMREEEHNPMKHLKSDEIYANIPLTQQISIPSKSSPRYNLQK